MKVVARKYEVLRTLGSGGSGVVLEARHTTLSGRMVALKHLHPAFRAHPESVQRFIREAQTVANLEHPGIVRVFDVEQDDELGPIVVMERLHGEGLDEVIARGPLAPARAVELLQQALVAVAFAHRGGVVHRDLKPANLFLVDERGVERVKILDFGIAHVAEGQNLTRPGDFMGTPRYASPEQRWDATKAGPRADVYALGITLVEMLTGGPAELDPPGMDARLVLDASADRFLPGPLRAFVEKATHHEATSRHADADAALAALRAAATEAGVELSPEEAASSGSPSTPPRSPSTPPRSSSTPSGPGFALEPTVSDRPDLPATISDPPRTAQPVVTTSASPAAPRSTWRLGVIGAVVAGCLGLAYVGFFLTSRGRPASIATTSAPSAPVAPSAPALVLGERGHATAVRACREWTRTLALGQAPDGSFGTEKHRTPTGWDTAQQLTALGWAKRGCNAIGDAPFATGVGALGRLEMKDGWGGHVDAETPATAWANLAVAAAPTSAGAGDLLRRARASLLHAQTETGGFRFLFDAKAEPNDNPYSSVLSTWALVDGEMALGAGTPPAEIAARKRATAWLRRALRDEAAGQVRGVAGLEEQATWVLLRARAHVADGDPGDAALIASLARSILDRCAATQERPLRCSRPIYEDGRTFLRSNEKTPALLTLWHPWVIAASLALARTKEETITAEQRARLVGVAEWAFVELESGINVLGAAPAYKLSEYLLVASEAAKQQAPAAR